jgi:molecular chaperone GrpE
MTTINAKKNGASPKKAAQTSARQTAAGDGKTPGPSPVGEDGKPVEAAEIPSADEADAEAPLSDEQTEAQTDENGAQNAQSEDVNAKYVRLAADFQNYKRRVEKEKSDIYTYANEKIAVDILAVIDNFERALESQGVAEAQEEGFAKGMELIFKQLLDILLKNGVEEIQSLGEDFDPAVHHAVMMEESETYESGKVSAVLGKGYRLKDRVIRPAMVKVAQ